MEEVRIAAEAFGVFALALASFLAWGAKKELREEVEAHMQVEMDGLKSIDKVKAEMHAVIEDNKVQWVKREKEHQDRLSFMRDQYQSLEAEKNVQLASTNGRLAEALRDALKFRMIVQDHSFHKAGKAQAHGRTYELWECDTADPTANTRILWPTTGVAFRDDVVITEGTGHA